MSNLARKFMKFLFDTNFLICSIPGPNFFKPSFPEAYASSQLLQTHLSSSSLGWNLAWYTGICTNAEIKEFWIAAELFDRQIQSTPISCTDHPHTLHIAHCQTQTRYQWALWWAPKYVETTATIWNDLWYRESTTTIWNYLNTEKLLIWHLRRT